MIKLGVKSDPILYRYSFDWLFELMAQEDIHFLQLGSFFELYQLDDDYFLDLRKKAESYNIEIKSVFTAHRELGGFFTGNANLEKIARKNYERLIEVAGLVGASYCGSNPGAVYRDHDDNKKEGIHSYLTHMKELSKVAKNNGLKALTIEPMSSLFEPPTTPEEIDLFINDLSGYHLKNQDTTVPTYLCGDISHGLADSSKDIIHKNLDLFEHGISKMAEFHFKNTDEFFHSTFGFSAIEQQKGIIDLENINKICEKHKDSWPVEEVIGYLEINGPKLGRDYTDNLLGEALTTSLKELKKVFKVPEITQK
ncbi:hypothetical protein HX109_11045 [Galbibacter sp. BG1]|uniref:hypothetical protein n=1 Tax=Galbibacter sp. BG1 TaxID=1170699 RepID=UPI0015BB455C|nr:hypothetical protein [Galbibacter sp. BG1]QLE02064.1 hypothetical protein HX109_11045 [Galbibacter sp. BG1]